MLGVDDESAMLDNDTGATACQLTAAQLSQLLGSMYAEEPMAPPADLAEMLVFDDCNGSDMVFMDGPELEAPVEDAARRCTPRKGTAAWYFSKRNEPVIQARTFQVSSQ